MIRRQLVGGALTLVVIAVIGLLYLQTLAQSRATRQAWMLTRDVAAGTLLHAGDVKRIRVPAAGDRFALLDGSPLNRRAAHRMSAETLLTADDLLGEDTVQVPVSVRAAPGVVAGDTLDVYAVVGSRTVLVGRHLVVVGTGSPMTLLVAAADEPNWVALEANNVSLFAAKSAGVGVPANPAVAVGDAISSLSGVSPVGPVLIGGAPPPGTPATPAPAPTPRPSPR
ncbi:MAG TPA: hypothetical protein VIC57_13145 [Candidatus Dormibacteraeota bacterium]